MMKILVIRVKATPTFYHDGATQKMSWDYEGNLKVESRRSMNRKHVARKQGKLDEKDFTMKVNVE